MTTPLSAQTIQKLTRICTATGRSLQTGEAYYSCLTEENGGYRRSDFAADAWPGPPPGCIAYWKARVPASSAKQKPTWNDELLSEWFYHLEGRTEPDRIQFRYVVALLLMRRRRLKFEDVGRMPEGQAYLVVRDAKTGKRLEIPDPHLTEDQANAVQDEVFRLLGWE